jgi:tRNA threonylcarbamoyladenosine biosynthesis protein TsaB
MKRLLAIETSSEACSAALSIDSEITERFELKPRMHAELLLPAIQSLMSGAELRLADLDAIAFGRGPGSFTSLRIGIGVVQGLAWGADLPVVPVSSLAAVAQQAAGMGASRISVAMDARMGEVYCCSYAPGESGIVEALQQERVCPPADSVTGDTAGLSFAGNGFERYPELHHLAHESENAWLDLWPRASAVCLLAVDWLKSNQALPAAQAQPVYIRNKVAEKPG